MKKKSPFTELLKNETMTKDSYLFNIEHFRASEETIFLKIEVFNYKLLSIFKFKVQIYLDENLKKLKVGGSINKVGLVSLSSKNVFQLIKGVLENAIEDGRIPFFPNL